VITTLALLTTAPVGSVTVPTILPVLMVVCAAAALSSSRIVDSTTNQRRNVGHEGFAFRICLPLSKEICELIRFNKTHCNCLVTDEMPCRMGLFEAHNNFPTHVVRVSRPVRNKLPGGKMQWTVHNT
jgi:hypothetical protein